MAYRAQGPRQVRQIKVGNKIRFEAEQASSDYTDTKMQKQRFAVISGRCAGIEPGNWRGNLPNSGPKSPP
jgi:Copper binding periplasmic protein CusF